MSASLMPMPKQAFFATVNGVHGPIVGGKVYAYKAGTLTPKDTYTTAAGNVANPNPVVLDARGEASVWLGFGDYDIVLKGADDALIWTQENVSAPRDIVSVKDFGAVGDGVKNDAAAFQSAISSGARHIYIPDGTYKIPTQIQTSSDGIELFGTRSSILLMGASQAAGDTSFLVSHSRFKASGFKLKSENRTTGFRVAPSAADISDVEIGGVEFEGCFYALRGDGSATYKIRNIRVVDCKSVGVLGQNCGHFFVDFGIGVTYIGNSVKYGKNSSAYGIADSVDIVITGNREELVEDSAAATEAACQIEDSNGANGVISGNSFQHDIWVAGSNGVNISGNTCRRMRLTVGNADGYNVHSVKYAANRAAQIQIDKFSTGTPAERISAQFDGNEISPSGRTVFGSAISSAGYINGDYVTRLGLSGNKVITDATTYALDINRAAGATFRFSDNDFGTKAHSLTGTTGLVYERNNYNSLYKTGSGYIDVYMSSTFSISAGAWQGTVLSGINANVNNEWSSSTFTPAESGCYRFTGIMTVDPDAAGNQIGFQLERTSGTPVVLARLAFARSVDANSVGIPLRVIDINLTAGDVVQLQHFLTGATTQFSTGTTVTNLQITRIR